MKEENDGKLGKILQGWKIACSGIPVEQVEKLKSAACSLGALFVEFDAKVSVLLCTKVGSSKTRAAQQLGIPLVHPDWLLSLDKWDNPIEAMSGFRLKPLQGLFISVTGLSLECRKKVEQVCVSLGASYSGDLSKTCSHLIGLEPKGLKYEFALKCKMHIVTIDWLWSCQKYEKLVDENQFKLVAQKQDKSAPFLDQTSTDPQKKRRKQSFFDDEDPIVPFCPKASSLILLSCRVYLLCCTEEEMKRASQLLDRTGATRSNCLFSPLTHIIVGSSDRSSSDLHRYRDLIICYFHSNVRFVTLEWLHCCIQNGQLAYDGPFRVSLYDLYPIETFSLHANSLAEESNSLSTTHNNKIEKGKIVQQSSFSSSIFRGLRFRFHSSFLSMGGLEQEVSNEIQAAQGVLVQESGIPTHLIVSHGAIDTFPEKICIVTSYWVKACLRFHRLLSPHSSILFRPLQWRLPLETMMPCKITLSGFYNDVDFTRMDYHREYIKEIIHLIGATYLERLSKRHTTHLIVENTCSEKYPMALKWGIPVVRLEWLFACFQSGTRVPIDRYRFQGEMTTASSLLESTTCDDSCSTLNGSSDVLRHSEKHNDSLGGVKKDDRALYPSGKVSTRMRSDNQELGDYDLWRNERRRKGVEEDDENEHASRNDDYHPSRSYWNEEEKWDNIEGLSQVVVFEDKSSLSYLRQGKNVSSSWHRGIGELPSK
ncbi:hypothetical protein GAYE_SCF19G3966 [Galdieria yellowstonensis]|uniref:BRCT domain-containing protein n=1 Tax=Galdieria yellowstonensis TaxID=3028027 RepID=A0AAV9IFB5_9RHOD|nr:hypothetical protein GAYE_SCF19G3966 [Galdieria yellowstonensis]